MENNSQTTTALINPNKLYKIETKLAPGMVLEIQKGLKKEETPIVLDKSTDASYQFFKLKPKGDNYIIESFPFQNFVIDVFQENNSFKELEKTAIPFISKKEKWGLVCKRVLIKQ